MKFKQAFLLLSIGCCSLTALANIQGDTLKGQNYLVYGENDYRVIVKFKKDYFRSLVKGKITFKNSDRDFINTSYFNDINLKYGISYNPVLDSTANLNPAFDESQFSGLMNVSSPTKNGQELIELTKALENSEFVAYAELVPLNQPAMSEITEDYDRFESALTTPDYSSRQGYQRADQVDVDYGRKLGLDGSSLQLNDIEYDWGQLKHEEFLNQKISYGLPRKKSKWLEHGVAVIGILIANADNDFGIKGAAPKAKMMVWPETHGRAKAIIEATKKNRPGDIIILEMQTGGPDGKLAPPDVSQSVWDAVKAATDAGVIIVSTAGNGNANLDTSAYKKYRDRGDNGVIMIGAGSSDTQHNKLSFSTYGKKNVHLQGWGQNVFTTGYNNVKDADDAYTSSFNGTSSAAPVVTQAVALVQDCHKKQFDKPLAPRKLREILIKTGTPQGSGGHIGPLPNIQKALKSFECTGKKTEEVFSE